MHLLMDATIILSISYRLPAFVMLTAVEFTLLLLVLPEVEAFGWEHLRADWQLEIFVWDQPVAVKIEAVEDFFEIVLRDAHAPEIEVKFEFSFANLARFLYVEVHERFSKCFPLEHNFLENFCLQVACHQSVTRYKFVIPLLLLLNLHMHVQLRILHRVVPKIKPFRLVYGIAEPLWEVHVAESALFVVVLVDDQFFQIIIVNVLFVLKMFQNVLNSDISVVVSVKRQKRLSHGLKAAWKFNLELNLELLQSFLDDLRLFVFVSQQL